MPKFPEDIFYPQFESLSEFTGQEVDEEKKLEKKWKTLKKVLKHFGKEAAFAVLMTELKK